LHFGFDDASDQLDRFVRHRAGGTVGCQARADGGSPTSALSEATM